MVWICGWRCEDEEGGVTPWCDRECGWPFEGVADGGTTRSGRWKPKCRIGSCATVTKDVNIRFYTNFPMV